MATYGVPGEKEPCVQFTCCSLYLDINAAFHQLKVTSHNSDLFVLFDLFINYEANKLNWFKFICFCLIWLTRPLLSSIKILCSGYWISAFYHFNSKSMIWYMFEIQNSGKTVANLIYFYEKRHGKINYQEKESIFLG